jgi:Lrp/AsnC family transcriptional regulator, leucine-responsive regulatory protein
MDRIDRALLRLLLEDGRTTYAALAQQLNLTDNGVRYRIDQLRKSGVIKRFTVQLDPAGLDRRLAAVLKIETLPEHADLVSETLRRSPQFLHVYNLAARTNVLGVAHFRDALELTDFVQKRLRLPEIKSVEVDVVTRVVREGSPAV